MDSDLHHVIQSKQVLTDAHIKHFMCQLACGLKYLHDHRIIHRDLKPGNLLVNKACQLRITDFGLARERPSEEDPEAMTVHVVTRWYRAPELMLLPDGLYTHAVDLWSVGCILAELLLRRPLFPGKTFIHQLALIFDVIGCPAASDTAHILHAEAKQFLHQQRAKQHCDWSELLPFASPDAWEVLDKLLVFNPQQRATVNQLLAMEYLQNCGLPESKIYPPVSSACEFAFEDASVSRYQVKQMIIDEAASFRREALLALAPAVPVVAVVPPAPAPAAASAAAAVRPVRQNSNRSLEEDVKANGVPRYLQGTASQPVRQQADAGNPFKKKKADPVPSVSVGVAAAVAAAERRLSDGSNSSRSVMPPLPVNPPNVSNLLPIPSSDDDSLPMRRLHAMPKSPARLDISAVIGKEESNVNKMFDMQALLARINKEDRFHQPERTVHKANHDWNESKDTPTDHKQERVQQRAVSAPSSPRTPPRTQSPPRSPLTSPSAPVSPSAKKSLIATYTSPRLLSHRHMEAEDRTPEVRKSGTIPRDFMYDALQPLHHYERPASSEPNSPVRRTRQPPLPLPAPVHHTVLPQYVIHQHSYDMEEQEQRERDEGKEADAKGRQEEEQKKKRDKGDGKKITVPLSPKFSVMSWQRRQDRQEKERAAAEVAAKLADKQPKKRAVSTNRMRGGGTFH